MERMNNEKLLLQGRSVSKGQIRGGYEVSITVNAQMSALEPTACVWLGTTTTEPPRLKRATPGALGAIPATASSFGGIDE